jgi:hypothetical protein
MSNQSKARRLCSSKIDLILLEPLLTKLNISLAGWSQFFFTLLICTWQNREGI